MRKSFARTSANAQANGQADYGSGQLHQDPFPYAKRVAIVSPTGSLYGAGRSLVELVSSLCAAGSQVGVVLPQGASLASKLGRFPCRIWYSDIPLWVQPRSERTQPKRDVADLENAAHGALGLLNGWKPDLVWTNSSITPVGALLAAEYGVPHIWHLRELTGNGSEYKFTDSRTETVRWIAAAQRRVAVSHFVKHYYEQMGCGPCEPIYNGIGSARNLSARKARRTFRAPVRLLMVGRVIDLKGQKTAIGAIAHLKKSGYPVQLRIVGSGDVAGCRTLARELGVNGSVEFTGFSDDPSNHYRWADIALACAGSEAMGRATAEAMSWALPVVGHRGAGTGELVAASGGGKVYDGSTVDLSRRIAELIEDPEGARRMGTIGQSWACTHCSSERHAQQIWRVLGSLRDHRT